MQKRLVFGLGLVVAAIGFYAVKLVRDAGAFDAVMPHSPTNCTAFENIPGPEDIEIGQSSGVAFLTSHLRVPHGAGQPVNGALYALDLSKPGASPEVLWRPSFDFRPHGLGLFEDENGTTLFLVNHRNDRDTVEVLKYADGRVEHTRTLEGAMAYNSNDIAAIDHHRFYQTHDHGARTELGKKWETYSRRGRGFVTFFDGQAFRLVAKNIAFANGITPSADRNALYLASMMGKKIIAYRRLPNDEIQEEWSLPLTGAPDNVTLDESGALWIAAHPNLFALKAQNEDLSKAAPSKVFRVVPPLGNEAKVENFLVDDGKKIASASVAARFGGVLLVGSVFDTRVLKCYFGDGQ